MSPYPRRCIIFILALTLLAACQAPSPVATPANPAPTSAAPPTSVSTVSPEPPTPTPEPDSTATLDPDAVWNGDYDETPVDLCPPVPDGLSDEEVSKYISATTDIPVFGAPMIEDISGGGAAWAQRGLHVNPQGEVFHIAVFGAATDEGRKAVETYTQELRVCFDHIPVGANPDDEAAEPVSRLHEPATTTPEDLVIAFSLQGVIRDGQGPAIQDRIADIAKRTNYQNWDEETKNVFGEQFGYVSAGDLGTERNISYFLDFIIDPGINNGVRHQYKEKESASASVTIYVNGDNGAGQVIGGICTAASTSPARTATVTKGRTEKATISHSQTYDFGVRGLQNASKYRVSGRWKRGYDDAPPTGSTVNCYP